MKNLGRPGSYTQDKHQSILQYAHTLRSPRVLNLSMKRQCLCHSLCPLLSNPEWQNFTYCHGGSQLVNSKHNLKAHPQAVLLNCAYLHNEKILPFTNCTTVVFPSTASFSNNRTLFFTYTYTKCRFYNFRKKKKKRCK